MIGGLEWSQFGVLRKPLRVSSLRQGDQRTRHVLQLPYRFSIPLVACSVLVHWLISQSLFLIAVETEDSGDWSFLKLGYSPIAIVFVLIVSCLLVVAIIVVGLFRLPSAMPVVGSCSLAIAAACHHYEGKEQPIDATRPVKWGVTWRGTVDDVTMGHCGFSASEVHEPDTQTDYS